MPYDRWPPLDRSDDDSFGPEDDVAAQDLDTRAPLVWTGPAGVLPDLSPVVRAADTTAERVEVDARPMLEALQPAEPGDESSLHDRELEALGVGKDTGLSDDVVEVGATAADVIVPEDDKANDTTAFVAPDDPELSRPLVPFRR